MNDIKKISQEYTFTHTVMGCDLFVTLISQDRLIAEHVYQEILSELYDYEKIFSRFDSQSELSQLNTHSTLTASHIFFDVFLEGEKLYYQTNGAFNPLLQVKTLGYTTSFNTLTTATKKIDPPLFDYNTSFEKIAYTENTREITLTKKQQLDFAGFLKGHVAQLLAQKYISTSITGILINIGGDIAAYGTDENNHVFICDLYNPLKKDESISIPLLNQSLSTSGIYRRSWNIGQKTMHHIVDPLSKESSESDLVSASIISIRGGLSDALATTTIALGSEKALPLLAAHNVQYILITKDGTIIKN